MTTAPTTFRVVEVGGCVRDGLMGLPTKDIDFAIQGLPSVDALVAHLETEGFIIHVVRPHELTVRAGVPQSHPLRARTKDADFVLCRWETRGDGRRPGQVGIGTLAQDLERRDFTVNAIARDPITGELFDPHGGRADIEARVLRFVGDPAERIEWDGLRVLRGLRFMVMKGLTPTAETWAAMNSDLAVECLGRPVVSANRVRDELERMFQFDSMATFDALASLADPVRRVLFKDGLRLSATMAK